MKFAVFVKATKSSEAGILPDPQLFADMDKYNEELVEAGVWVAGEGLKPTSQGARMKFTGNKRVVVDGPFPETKELVAGFWIWSCKSKEEAIQWLQKCPKPHHEDCEIELRPMYELEDLASVMSEEQRKKEERLRAEIRARK